MTCQGESREESLARINRRQFLGVAAVGGSALVAGCFATDSGDGGTNGSGASGDDGRTDLTFSVSRPNTYINKQFNYYNPTNQALAAHEPGQMLYDKLMMHTPPTDEIFGFIVTDHQQDGRTLTLTVSDEYVWHDGDPVTATDVATQFELDIYSWQPRGGHTFLKAAEAVDDTTVELTLHEPFNDTLVFQDLIDQRLLTVKHDVYKKWLQRFRKADGDEKAVAEVYTKLSSWRIDEPVGNGPFQFEDVDPQRFLMTLFEDYPGAKDINFTGYEFRSFTEPEAMDLAIRNGDISGNMSYDIDSKAELEQYSMKPERYPLLVTSGNCFMFDHSDVHCGRTDFRKAFAYIVNSAHIETNTPMLFTAADTQYGGLTPDGVDRYLGDIIDSFTDYAVDKATATDLLKDLDYRKSNGKWVDPNGSAVKIEILTAAPWAQAKVAETAVSNLNQFGINAELRAIEPTDFYARIDDGDYQVTMNWWGGGGIPYYAYGMWTNPDGGVSAHMNLPFEFSIPPIAQPNGKLSTVNAGTLVNQLKLSDKDETTELTRQLAWLYNQTLPVMPVTLLQRVAWIYRTDNWKITGNNKGLLKTENPVFNLPRFGALKAK